MKKKVFAVIALFMCVFLFAGCTDKGIQGTWELYEEYESDGTKISRKELDENGVNEKYVIEGDTVHYSCALPGAKKDIEIDMTLIDKGDNRYEFKLESSGDSCCIQFKNLSIHPQKYIDSI